MTNDESPSTFKITRRRALAAIGVIGAAGASAGAGTFAYFEDTESSTGNTLAAGTMDLTLDESSFLSTTASGLAPGDSVSGTLDLTNSGSIAGDHVELAFSAHANESDGPNGNNEADTAPSTADRMAEIFEVTKVEYPDGTSIAPGDANGNGIVDLADLVEQGIHDDLPAPSSTETLDIELKFVSTSSSAYTGSLEDDDYQGDDLEIGIQAGLAQASDQDLLTLYADSLLAYYTLDGSTSEEINGLDGTTHGGVSFTSGKVGSAASFDGTDAYIEVPDDPLLDVTSSYSQTAWVRPTSVSGKNDITMKDPSQWTFGFQIRNGKLRAGFEDEQDNNYIGVKGKGGSIPENQWTHLAVVYDGSSVEGYIDGTQVFDITKSTDGSNIPISQISPSTNDQPLRIGRGEDYFAGKIDDLRFYDRALSVSEVNAIANNS